MSSLSLVSEAIRVSSSLGISADILLALAFHVWNIIFFFIGLFVGRRLKRA